MKHKNIIILFFTIILLASSIYGDTVIRAEDDWSVNEGTAYDGKLWINDNIDIYTDGMASTADMICYDWDNDGNYDNCYWDDNGCGGSCNANSCDYFSIPGNMNDNWKQACDIEADCQEGVDTSERICDGCDWDTSSKQEHIIAVRIYHDCDNSLGYRDEEIVSPTFRFDTDKNAYCRIGITDINYTAMGITRNCSTTGAQEHICTLTVQDQFILPGQNFVYISCSDTNGLESSASSSGALEMDISGASEVSGDDAIELAIDTSEIAGSVTKYENKQIYARDTSNNQFTGTFDWVASSGNKRWAINYVSAAESPITGLFNLSPALYVLQLQNQTNNTIIDIVGKMINDTYP